MDGVYLLSRKICCCLNAYNVAWSVLPLESKDWHIMLLYVETRGKLFWVSRKYYYMQMPCTEKRGRPACTAIYIHTRARHYCCSVIGQEKRRDHSYIRVPSCKRNYGVLAIQRKKHIQRIACLACATYQDSLVLGRVLYTWWLAAAVTRVLSWSISGQWTSITRNFFFFRKRAWHVLR